ncbi:MAG: hypothetical protein FOGNACKC_00949 [Anaerolineae bacterium]|nr:hypothetical protein [Anaerolineae bacterium]
MEPTKFEVYPESPTLVDPETNVIGWVGSRARTDVAAWLALQQLLLEMEQRAAYLMRVANLNAHRS